MKSRLVRKQDTNTTIVKKLIKQEVLSQIGDTNAARNTANLVKNYSFGDGGGSFGSGGSGGGGTVTSVGLDMPTDVFTVANTPITSTGNIGVTFVSQLANKFLASPNGAPGGLQIRSIVKEDLPTAIALLQLTNVVTNGFLKTISSNGTLAIDTSTYLTGNQTITLSGEATGSGTTAITVTLTNSAVIGKVLTGFTSGAGSISSADSLLGAIQKLDGNVALKAPIASPTFTGTFTITGLGTGFVRSASGVLSASALVIGDLPVPTNQIVYGVAGVAGSSAGFTYAPVTGMGLDSPLNQTLSSTQTGEVSSVTSNGVPIYKQEAMGRAFLRGYCATAVFQISATGTSTGVDNGSVYTDVTASYNSGFFNVFGSGASLKRIYIGYKLGAPTQFSIICDSPSGGTAGVGGTVTAERWNGSAWVTFTAPSFLGSGASTFTASSAQTTVNGVTAYWYRLTINTTFSTAPVFRFTPINGMFQGNSTPDNNSLLFLTPAGVPANLIANMTNYPMLGIVCSGNGEQNIFTVYSGYSSSVLFNLGGDGSMDAVNADNRFRSLRLLSGPMNVNGTLSFNTPSGFSSYDNYFIGGNFESGKNYLATVWQRNGTTFYKLKFNGEEEWTGNIRLTSPANLSLTVGTVATSSTTVTGTSTQFTREISIDDEISFSTAPTVFYRVTAIASDTSLTVASTPGTLSAQTVIVRKPLERIYDQSNVLRRKTEYNGVQRSSAGRYDMPVTTAYSATITLDLATGNQFEIACTGNFTLANFTNPNPGQLIMVTIKADATGNYVPTFGAKFRANGTMPLPTVLSGPNKTDVLGFRYNQVDDKFDYIAQQLNL